MAKQDIAAAMQRVETVLRHRPETGLHDDAPAAARWEGGTRVVASHANGTQMTAAVEGIALSSLEVRASSRSDVRGLLGMADARGEPVQAGPRDVQLLVRISAPGVAPERLRALVEDGLCHSPIPNAVQSATPLALHIDVDVEQAA